MVPSGCFTIRGGRSGAGPRCRASDGGRAAQPPEAVFMGCVWTRPGDRPLSYLPPHPGKSPVPCVRLRQRHSAAQPPEAVFMGCVWTRPGDRSLSYLPSHPGKSPVPCVRLRQRHSAAQPPRGGFYGMCVDATWGQAALLFALAPRQASGAVHQSRARQRGHNRPRRFLWDVCRRDLRTGRSPICPRTPASLRCRVSG